MCFTVYASMLCLMLCASGDDSSRTVSSSKSARGSTNAPDITYHNKEMIVRIWNPRQISALASKPDFFKSCTQLQFDFSGTTDKDLAMLPVLPSLEAVSIYHERAITDRSLRVLATFPKLRELHLEHTAITGTGFRHFASRKREYALQWLSLAENHLTADGLLALTDVGTLRKLFISFETGIRSQDALEYLPRLRKLGLLVLRFEERYKWTADEQQRLQKRMPHCQVMFGVRMGESIRIRHRIGSGNPFSLSGPEEEKRKENKVGVP
jgi:hypothetical protein